MVRTEDVINLYAAWLNYDVLFLHEFHFHTQGAFNVAIHFHSADTVSEL